MAEPLGWLKLGPRSRTPIIPLQVSPPESKANGNSQLGDARRPSSPPVSNHATLPESGLEPPFTDDDPTGRLVRNQDQVWYNPVRHIRSHAHAREIQQVTGTAW